jgi:hypothetical protein
MTKISAAGETGDTSLGPPGAGEIEAAMFFTR